MMRRITLTTLLCLSALSLARIGAADCLSPSSNAISSVADALTSAVNDLESDRADIRATKPSVLLKIGKVGDINVTGGNAPGTAEKLSSEAQKCLDNAELESRVREHAQEDVRFVVGDQFDDVLKALKRVETVGLENLDAEARNVFRVRSINYIAYLKPRVTGVVSVGEFDFSLQMTVDVVSVESGAIRSERPMGKSVLGRYATPGGPPVGLPPGAVTLACGCWGPVMAGATRANSQCQSGVDVANMCPAPCFANGVPAGNQWAAVCR